MFNKEEEVEEEEDRGEKARDWSSRGSVRSS